MSASKSNSTVLPDWYAVLEVAPDASEDVIHHAYRALVKKFHPDKFHGDSSSSYVEEKLKTINAAYNVLGDATKRSRYDRERRWQSEKMEQPKAPVHWLSAFVGRLFGKVPWWLWLMLWIVIFPRILRFLMVSYIGQVLLALATVFVFWRLMPKRPTSTLGSHPHDS